MERDLIRRIARAAERAAAGLVAGIGDDCAVGAPTPGHVLLLTTDTLAEGVHFRLETTDPFRLGRKTAAVNLSDIAAMGGRPRWALLSLAVPAGLDPAFWDPFLAGLTERLEAFGAALAGGDTVRSPGGLVLTLALAGEAEPGRVMGRAGARPGDIVYCSGPLGEAAAGLALLEAGLCPHRPRPAAFRRLVRAQLDPEPRLGLGRALAATGAVTAAIDLSDGLATDLAHLCEAGGVGAEVDAARLPLSRALRRAARRLDRRPLDWALAGGEDYELLWTVPPGREGEVRAAAARALGRPPHRIGRIVAGRGVRLREGARRRDITFTGHEHRF